MVADMAGVKARAGRCPGFYDPGGGLLSQNCCAAEGCRQPTVRIFSLHEPCHRKDLRRRPGRGESRRFGQAKALATLRGTPMASWGVRALRAAGLAVGFVSDQEGVEAALGVPVRPDREAGLGPIGGLWTALQWAEEPGDDGVLLLRCDLPLMSEAMLRTVLGWSARAAAVVPMGPEGPAPSRCARCTEPRARRRSSTGSAPKTGPCAGWQRLSFIGEEAVAEVSDPRVSFLNVNTVEDRDRAETLLDSQP